MGVAVGGDRVGGARKTIHVPGAEGGNLNYKSFFLIRNRQRAAF